MDAQLVYLFPDETNLQGNDRDNIATGFSKIRGVLLCLLPINYLFFSGNQNEMLSPWPCSD